MANILEFPDKSLSVEKIEEQVDILYRDFDIDQLLDPSFHVSFDIATQLAKLDANRIMRGKK